MNDADDVLRKNGRLTTINVRIFPVQPKTVKHRKAIVRIRSSNSIFFLILR